MTVPPIPVPSYLYGLALKPAAMVVLASVNIVTTDGELRIPVPATNLGVPFYAQALFGSSNPGSGPASFSNVLSF